MAIDPLSVQHSPQSLSASGVRRANNRPLIITFSIVMGFIALIALVAVKRAHPIASSVPMVTTDEPSDSSTMAADIIAGHPSGMIAARPTVLPTKPVSEPPSAALPAPVIRSKPPHRRNRSIPLNPEVSRIRQLKAQQFELAVIAKTTIEWSNSSYQTHMPPATTTDALTAIQQLINQLPDPALRYQEQLAAIQAASDPQKQGDLALGNTQSMPGLHHDRWQLESTVETPRATYELRAGAVIPGVLISGIQSDLPGQIVGQVAQSVYDTATGQHLLIPQGTRLVGTYSSQLSYGQRTLLVAWQRLIFPDGKVLDIGSMPGANGAGYAGFRDEVDNHYGRLFGGAILMSGVTAGLAYSQPSVAPLSAPTARSALSEALGQQLGEVTAQLIAKNLAIASSLTIRPGFRFNISVVCDLTFAHPYHAFDY